MEPPSKSGRTDEDLSAGSICSEVPCAGTAAVHVNYACRVRSPRMRDLRAARRAAQQGDAAESRAVHMVEVLSPADAKAREEHKKGGERMKTSTAAAPRNPAMISLLS